MVAISIQIEGQDGLTWARWQRLVEAVEAAGFAGLFRSDHFTNAHPADKDALEAIVSLTYLADHTRRLHFGPLVSPVSFRHPTLLARQAAALDDLSGGRMILGVGAGWQEREHTLFGHDLGDVPARMARLQEGLEVITRLLNSDEPVTFEGTYYQLRGATLLPRPQRPGGPRILLGGNGPRRTLPLVARYADVWNAISLTPAEFHERSTTLDGLLREAGREPGSVRRTLMTAVWFGRDMAELERRLTWRDRVPALARLPLAEALETLDKQEKYVVGTPDMVVKQIKRFADAGVDELMLQWFDMDDSEGLQAFGESVLPLV
jgi:F420-dependent oxidoreductase-like protein